MERIAAGNLIIEQDSERWRLLVNGADGGDRLLLEAAYGEPVRYESAFGTRRGLSIDRETGGTIAPDRIERVVVGWSEKDAAWHLGLMLDQAYTDARGSRWCGLVTWSDTDHDSAETIAGVGQSLAQKLARPFALVPPKGASNGGGASAAAAAGAAPAAPEYVVIKRVPLTGLSEAERAAARREAYILAHLSHPCVIRHLEHFEADGFLCVVTEVAEPVSYTHLTLPTNREV